MMDQNDVYRRLVNQSSPDVKWSNPEGMSIPVGKQVVLYGAGYFGITIFDKLINKGNEILAWYDKNYKRINVEGRKMHVSDPSELFSGKVQYDYIVIGIHIPEVLDEAIKYLLDNGIDQKRMVIVEKYDQSLLPEEFKNYYHETEFTAYNKLHDIDAKTVYEHPYSTTSMICNQEFLDMPFTYYWSKIFKLDAPFYHRKLWEDVYIVHSLYERGMLQKGKRGIGFGVGQEFLPDLFASYGCDILATDLSAEDSKSQGWIDTDQHASGNLENLRSKRYCDDSTFYERVHYMDLDMNSIPDSINGYDFCWSTCSLEHIGGIRQGADFIKNSMKTLREGGVAIHTTEYNLFSNEGTIETPSLSLFRKKDMEMIQNELESEGYTVEPFDFYLGTTIYDGFIDLPPHWLKNIHLRLLIDNYPCTSIGIIVHKN